MTINRNERKFKAHRNKLNIRKFKNQQKEYNRQLNNNGSYKLLRENLLKLKEDFNENIKTQEYTWRRFYNIHKNNQLTSIKQFNFNGNQHKTVGMWKSVLSLMKQFQLVKPEALDKNDPEYEKKEPIILDSDIKYDYNKIMLIINQQLRYVNKMRLE